MKSKKILKTIAIVLSSLVLVGLTVFLGYKIYQTRRENIAPTRPEAISEACTLEFSISPPLPECYETCDPLNSLCPEGLDCQDIDGSDVCVNPDCPLEEDCLCPEPTPTPISTPTPKITTTPIPTTVNPTEPTQEPTIVTKTPTKAPPTALPEVGNILPTIGVILGGLILGALGFFFVF